MGPGLATVAAEGPADVIGSGGDVADHERRQHLVPHRDGVRLRLTPAWLQLGAYDRHDGAAIAAQRRPGVAVLSASYDPGWTATVNGRPQPTRMVAPALVAVDVPAGTDNVVFRFHGYGDYLGLLARSGLILIMLAAAPAWLRRARRRRGAKETACR